MIDQTQINEQITTLEGKLQVLNTKINNNESQEAVFRARRKKVINALGKLRAVKAYIDKFEDMEID